MDDLYAKLGISAETFVCNDMFADAKGNTMRIWWHDGTAYPPFGDHPLDGMRKMDIRDDDIIVEGYPKTGAHWIYEVLTMMTRREAKAEGVGKTQCFMDMTNPDVIKVQPSPRILNTHCRYRALPEQVLSKKTKLIMTVRNPKDTLVSFYNFHKTFLPYEYNGEFNDFFDMYMDGKVDYGCYFDFHNDWEKKIREHPDHPILVVSYEDMKEDLAREVRRMAQFLDIQLDDQLVLDIAKAGSFEEMVKAQRIVKAVARKGQVGDWKNWFTVAQNELMDAKIAEKGLTIYTPKYTLT